MVFKMIDLKEKIKPYMSEKRYNHTLSVAEECARLAEMFKVDRDILTAAGYLHDITKEMPVEEQILLCKDNGVILDKTVFRVMLDICIADIKGRDFDDRTFAVDLKGLSSKKNQKTKKCLYRIIDTTLPRSNRAGRRRI